MFDTVTRRIQLLLIEDREEDVEFIQLILSFVKDFQHTLEWTSCLKDAFHLLQDPKKHYDLILLDLNLQETKGIETLSILMSHMPTVPVVVLTGVDDEQIAIEALQKGAQDYLIKGNVNGKSLTRIIRYAIERKRSQDLLRMSEDRFHQLVKTASVSMVCLSPAHRILEFNREAEQIFHARKEEVLGRDYFDLFVPEQEQPKLESELATALRGKIITHSSERIHDMQGDPKILMCNLSRVTNPDGTAVGAMMCGHDITESEAAERTLEMKDKLYRILIRHTPNTAVFLINREWKFTLVEGTALQSFGVTPKSFEGKKVLDFLSFAQNVKVKSHLEKAFQGEEETFRENFQSYPYQVHLLPIRNDKQEITCVMAIVRD